MVITEDVPVETEPDPFAGHGVKPGGIDVTPPIDLTQNAVCSQVNRKPPGITSAGITAQTRLRLQISGNS